MQEEAKLKIVRNLLPLGKQAEEPLYPPSGILQSLACVK